jgi:hypothetical protein
MRYRRLSASGDYMFGRGGANFWVNEPGAVAQAILTRLKLLQGEWFLDSTAGTPYATSILGTGKSALRDLAIQQEILQTNGAQSIDQYSSEFDPIKRLFSVQATVTTIFGQTQVQTSL